MSTSKAKRRDDRAMTPNLEPALTAMDFANALRDVAEAIEVGGLSYATRRIIDEALRPLRFQGFYTQLVREGGNLKLRNAMESGLGWLGRLMNNPPRLPEGRKLDDVPEQLRLIAASIDPVARDEVWSSPMTVSQLSSLLGIKGERMNRIRPLLELRGWKLKRVNRQSFMVRLDTLNEHERRLIEKT